MNHKLIRHCRHFSGLSQLEMSERLGISQSNVCKYEYGTLQIPHDTIRKMKEVFREHGIGQEEIKLIKIIFSKR